MAAVLLAGAAVTGGVAQADTAPPEPSIPPTVSADALPTVQVDGVVWAQAVVGDRVYAGGKFTTARPAGAAPGTSTTPRENLLAYDIKTGALVTSFAPTLNGQVLSLVASSDGSRIYVAGEFTQANGAARYRIAAYNTSDGSLVSNFRPSLNSRARALVVTDSTVYVGGGFSAANGNPRSRLASFRTSDGGLLPWAPSADNQVLSMVMAPDRSKVVVGGQFTTVNGTSAYGMTAVDPISGAVFSWAANTVVKNAGTSAGITSLSADGGLVYGTGYKFNTTTGNFEGTFAADPANGKIVWLEDCHGDTYSSFPVGDVVYTAGHAHFCGNIGGFPSTDPKTHQRALAFTRHATGKVARNTVSGYSNFGGQPAPSILTWFPEIDAGTFTGQNQGAWSVSGNSDYVVLAGEFPRVNQTAQQGLVRFAVRRIAPNDQGPRLGGSSFVPTLVSQSAGTARASWTANWDRDNELLSYKVFRDGNTATPVFETTARSTFWNRPLLGFHDSGLTPGQSYRYRLRVTDPLGNTVSGDERSVVASSMRPAPVSGGAPSTFTAVTPQRILDTRTGTGAPRAKVGAGGTVDLAVRGVATAQGAVPANASAVVLNVTVTDPTAATDVRAYPTDGGVAGVSNINAGAGQTVPNLVTVRVGASGAVTLRNSAGSVHLIADIAGWYTPDTAGAGFAAVDPSRVLDTRAGVGAELRRVGTRSSVDLAVTGVLRTADGGTVTVPADARAVVLNVTAAGATAPTDVRVYPVSGAAVPVVSNLNVRAGQTAANLVTVAVGQGGRVRLRNLAGSVHLVADLAGYYARGAAGRFVPVDPTRFLDTRNATGAVPIPTTAQGFVDLRVAGARGVPVNATAAVLNLTGTGTSAATDVRAYPRGATRVPTVSNLNLVRGDTRANLAIVRTGTDGRVRIRNSAGQIHLIVDLAGYMVG